MNNTNNQQQKIRVASFDVDPQKGFTPLCPDEMVVPEGDEIVDELNRNAELAQLRLGSRDAHPPKADWVADNPDEILSEVGQKNVDVKWPRHCVVGTKGFELLDGLPHPVEGYDFFVSKGLEPDCHPYGACFHDLVETKTTGVIEFLSAQNITHVIVGGLATEFCVMQTALQLQKAGFQVIINLSACRGVSQEGITEGIEKMKDAGIVIKDNVDSVKDYLQKVQ